ncbi:hypothetical protein ACP275_14G173200 [Erythranthe tilingii]
MYFSFMDVCRNMYFCCFFFLQEKVSIQSSYCFFFRSTTVWWRKSIHLCSQKQLYLGACSLLKSNCSSVFRRNCTGLSFLSIFILFFPFLYGKPVVLFCYLFCY